MRKFVVLMLFALLSIASVSQVMADYQLPSDTIDIPQPNSIPCDLDAGQGNIGGSTLPDCCDYTSTGQGYIGTLCDPCIVLNGNIGDPCDPSCDLDSPSINNVDFDDCCELSAGQGYIGVEDDPCIIIICVIGGGGDAPDCCDLEFDIDDIGSVAPNTISFDYQEPQITNLDSIFGIIPDCDDDSVQPKNDSDIDADGILDENDNCPTDYNPDQANTWGTGAGNACEIPYRSDNNLVFGFFGSSDIGFYGFCSEEGCQYIATVSPANFAGIMSSDDYQDAGDYAPELTGGKVLNTEDGTPSSLTVLFQVGTDADGNPIYQINVYILQQKLGEDGETEVFPMLVDDDVNITVKADGTWTWWDKNPN